MLRFAAASTSAADRPHSATSLCHHLLNAHGPLSNADLWLKVEEGGYEDLISSRTRLKRQLHLLKKSGAIRTEAQSGTKKSLYHLVAAGTHPLTAAWAEKAAAADAAQTKARAEAIANEIKEAAGKAKKVQERLAAEIAPYEAALRA
jgi:hypothetical protein